MSAWNDHNLKGLLLTTLFAVLATESAHSRAHQACTPCAAVVAAMVLLLLRVTAVMVLLVHIEEHLATLSEECTASSRREAALVTAAHLVRSPTSCCAECHCADAAFTGWQWVSMLVVLDWLLLSRGTAAAVVVFCLTASLLRVGTLLWRLLGITGALLWLLLRVAGLLLRIRVVMLRRVGRAAASGRRVWRPARLLLRVWGAARSGTAIGWLGHGEAAAATASAAEGLWFWEA